LLRRTGQGEDGEKRAEMDLRALKSVNVIKDLNGVLAWVEKMNAREKD
jgi:hypothetical protein